MWEAALLESEGLIAGPDRPDPAAAVPVLSGSSGRVERERVHLLASRDVVALSLKWFGDVGQTPGICEVPLEVFDSALDHLARYSSNLAVLGVSKGAEAALLLGARYSRLGAVIACSPSSVVWANLGAGMDGASRPLRSSWTADGSSLPFVPYDEEWAPPTDDGPPAFRGLYERSLKKFANRVPDATIPVERIAGRVIVTGGGDDQVWPSDFFAREVAHRRALHGLDTTVITSATAGHRVVLPGEQPEVGGLVMSRGGSAEADADLGERVWAEITRLFGLS